jgi:hypothetical protein
LEDRGALQVSLFELRPEKSLEDRGMGREGEKIRRSEGEKGGPLAV